MYYITFQNKKGNIMPFKRTKPLLQISAAEKAELELISNSRTEAFHRVQRSKFLLQYFDGTSINQISTMSNINRQHIDRLITKALNYGVTSALDDFQRSGKPQQITPEAITWILSLACQKPKALGYSYELWTYKLLAQHVQMHCLEAGHPSLQKLSKGTISKILKKQHIQIHKIRYYVERRDPQFDEKMAHVLHVYKEIQVLQNNQEDTLTAFVSYDEKPGIQAIANTAPDLPPVPNKNQTFSRDYEYKRLGTLSLLASIDLITGEIIAMVEQSHRSLEFIEFLKMLDDHYSSKEKIKVILDNHSIHISKQTKQFLELNPNRFEFVFTPKHGSWLNLIETFFSKMSRSMLRGIRVSSTDELKLRILSFIDDINKDPVVYKWQYKMNEVN
jgi:transposase